MPTKENRDSAYASGIPSPIASTVVPTATTVLFASQVRVRPSVSASTNTSNWREVGDQPGAGGEEVRVAGQRGREHPVDREDRHPEDDQDGEHAAGDAEPEAAHHAVRSAARATARLPATTISAITMPTMPTAAAAPSCLESKAWE